VTDILGSIPKIGQNFRCKYVSVLQSEYYSLIRAKYLVKHIKKEKDKVTLLPENLNYKPIVIQGETILVIWGVVTYSIKNHQKK